MGTYWGYRCETCDVNSDRNWNHGDLQLELIYQHWPAIQEVHQLTMRDIPNLELRCLGWYDDPSPLEFLTAHQGHVIVLSNEYGQTRAIPTLSPRDHSPSPL